MMRNKSINGRAITYGGMNNGEYLGWWQGGLEVGTQVSI